MSSRRGKRKEGLMGRGESQGALLDIKCKKVKQKSTTMPRLVWRKPRVIESQNNKVKRRYE